jgi:hypothetical protein
MQDEVGSFFEKFTQRIYEIYRRKTMGKQLRVWGLAILMVGLVALPALAVAPAVPNPLTVSSEAMGITRTVAVAGGAGADAVTVTFTQNASVATVIQVTLVNSSFAAGTYNICDDVAGTQIATFAPGAGVTQANFQVIVDTVAGTVLNLTTDACAAATDQPMSFQLNAVASAASSATATISFALFTGALVPLDPAPGVAVPTATLATVSPEYVPGVANSNHVIDVVTAGANGFQFTAATGSSAAGANGVAPIVLADSGDLGALITITVNAKTNDDASFGLVTSANVIVSGADFSGISRIFLAAGGIECDSTAPGTTANLVQSALNPTSPTTLLLPTDDAIAANTGFDQTTTAGARTFRLCVLVNGTTFLNPRILLASVDVNVTGAGALDPTATTAAAAQTWNINGADFRLTGVKGTAFGENTVISINNHGVNNATLRRVEVRRLDQLVGPGLAAPSCVVTDVPAATKTIFSQSGGTVNAAVEITALCSGQAPFILTEAYGLRLVLDMAPADVGVQATRVFSDGRLLSVPVLKNPPVIPGVATGTQFPQE